MSRYAGWNKLDPERYLASRERPALSTETLYGTREAPPLQWGGLVLTLPYPPTANHLHTVANGRKVLSKAGRDYQRAVGQAFLVQRPKPWVPLQGRFHVILWYYPADHQGRDVDNPIKAPLDALTKAGLWGDDSQVKWIEGREGQVCTPPYITVHVLPFTGFPLEDMTI